MQRMIGFTPALLVAFAATAAVAGDVESGLQVGDKAGAFNVNDVTGPKQGTSLCYR